MKTIFHNGSYAEMKKTALYRHFDAFGRLLYVGISLCAFQRTRQHGRAAAWFEDVTRIDIEWFATRCDAEAAEWQAIKRERPVYNRTFNQHELRDDEKPMLVIGDTFITRAELKRIAVHT